MKVIKRLFATVLACTFVMVGVTPKAGFTLDIVEFMELPDYTEYRHPGTGGPVLDMEEWASPIIYSHMGTGVSEQQSVIYVYQLYAKESGSIHIDIGIKGYLKGTVVGRIGTISYEENKVKSISEASKILENGVCVVNIGTYCTDEDMKRNGNLDDQASHYALGVYKSLDLVASNTDISFAINVFGDALIIPFGDSFSDKDTYIQELENKVTELENKITELESNPITSYKPGDINGDGIIDATDASSILCYYAYVMTGGDGNLNILDFVENEDEYMAANVTTTTTTIPITTTTTTQTTTTTTTTPSMDIGGSQSNYESEFSSNNTGGIRNQFDTKPMG